MGYVRIPSWIIALIFIIGIAWYLGYISIPVPQNIEGIQKTVEQVAVTKPLLITVMDPIAGSVVSGATVQIYKGTTLMETLTTDSNGQATTSLRYSSGDILNILITNGNSKEWLQVKVPYMSPVDAENSNTNYLALDFFTLGTYTIKVMDQFGNVYTSGDVINFTQLGVDTVTLTIMIYNNVDNTGYRSSHDPINNVDWRAVLVASSTNPVTVWSGFDRSVTRGTTMNFLKVIPDDGLTRQKVGNTYVKDGVYSFTVTINKGTLSGSSETWTLTLYAYFDPEHFAETGIGSNDQLSLATFTLVLGT